MSTRRVAVQLSHPLEHYRRSEALEEISATQVGALSRRIRVLEDLDNCSCQGAGISRPDK